METLCFADLLHYFGLHIEGRTRELRELLNVQVSAAAVTIDGGKAYEALNVALGGKPSRKGGPDRRGRPDPAEAKRKASEARSAEAAEVMAGVEHLWSDRNRP